MGSIMLLIHDRSLVVANICTTVLGFTIHLGNEKVPTPQTYRLNCYLELCYVHLHVLNFLDLCAFDLGILFTFPFRIRVVQETKPNRFS